MVVQGVAGGAWCLFRVFVVVVWWFRVFLVTQGGHMPKQKYNE